MLRKFSFFMLLFIISSCADDEFVCENILFDDGKYYVTTDEDREFWELKKKFKSLEERFMSVRKDLQEISPEDNSPFVKEEIIELLNSAVDPDEICDYRHILGTILLEEGDLSGATEQFYKNKEYYKSSGRNEFHNLANIEFIIAEAYLTDSLFVSYFEEHLEEGMGYAKASGDSVLIFRGRVLKLRYHSENFNPNECEVLIHSCVQTISSETYDELLNEFFTILQTVEEIMEEDVLELYSFMSLRYPINGFSATLFESFMVFISTRTEEKMYTEWIQILEDEIQYYRLEERIKLYDLLIGYYDFAGNDVKKKEYLEQKQQSSEHYYQLKSQESELRKEFQNLNAELIQISEQLNNYSEEEITRIKTSTLFTGECISNDSVIQFKEGIRL